MAGGSRPSPPARRARPLASKGVGLRKKASEKEKANQPKNLALRAKTTCRQVLASAKTTKTSEKQTIL